LVFISYIFYPFFLLLSFLFLSVDEGFGRNQQRSRDGKEYVEAESDNEMNILEKVVVLSRCVQTQYELFLSSFNTVFQLDKNKATVADEMTTRHHYFKILDH